MSGGYICPVCGWHDLPRYPANYLICPCCGTEFDLDTTFKTKTELRQRWIAKGMDWSSFYHRSPHGWDAERQLASIQEMDVQLHNLNIAEKEVTNSGVIRMWWSEEDTAYIAIAIDRPSISGVGYTPQLALEELAVAQHAVICMLEDDEKKIRSQEVREGLRHSTDQIVQE